MSTKTAILSIKEHQDQIENTYQGLHKKIIEQARIAHKIAHRLERQSARKKVAELLFGNENATHHSIQSSTIIGIRLSSVESLLIGISLQKFYGHNLLIALSNGQIITIHEAILRMSDRDYAKYVRCQASYAISCYVTDLSTEDLRATERELNEINRLEYKLNALKKEAQEAQALRKQRINRQHTVSRLLKKYTKKF